MADYAAEFAELMPEKTTLPRQGVGINVKRLLKLRGQLMAIVAVAIAVPACVAVFFLVPREYVASQDIEFRATTQRILTDAERNISGTPAYESFVNTQIQLITGYPILSRVLDNDAVKAIPAIASRDDALFYLRDRLEAETQIRTELVRFTFRHEDRNIALTVLETVLSEYNGYLEEQETEQGNISRRALADQEESLAQELNQQREQILALRKELGVPVGEEAGVEPTETESFRINLANAEGDITSADTALRQSRKLVERVEAFLAQWQANPSEPIYALGVEERVNLNPNVTLLAEQVAAEQQEMASLEEIYVEDAPQLEVKRSEVRGVENKLEEVRAKARGDALRSLLAEYEFEVVSNESNLEDAVDRRERFMGLLEEYDEERVELSQGLAELAELERRSTYTRDQLQALRNRMMNLSIESQAPARVSVVGEVSAPGEPESTERQKLWLVSLLAAIMGGIAVGLLKETTDQNIRSAEDVAYVTDLPVLAAIPDISEDRLPADAQIATVSADYPGSMTADEFRRIVARILYAGRRAGETKTCVVASAARGDGKTTLACNLALILAQADRRVLLVDVDSRNPAVERCFGLTPSAGLGELLSGEGLDHDPDRSTAYENLFVMGPGLHSEDMLERLASRDMADFLEGAEEIFDHIIVDTPASLLMSETRLLAPLADGVVVATGAGISSFGMLRRALRSIEDSGGNIMGVVINRVRQAPGGYLRRNLESYYQQDTGHTVNGGARIPRPRRSGSTAPSIVLVDDDNEDRG